MVFGQRKIGRPRKASVDVVLNGQTIDGLACQTKHKPNGETYTLFYLRGNPRITFGREISEAVRRYRLWQCQQTDGLMAVALTPEQATQHIAGDMPQLSSWIPEDLFWSRMRDEIINNPQLVAQKTGIEQIGYLEKLEKPEPALMLEQIWQYYSGQKTKMSRTTRRGIEKRWQYFCKETGATTTDDLTADVLVEFGDTVKRAGKDVNNKLKNVLAIFRFCHKKNKDRSRISKILTNCSGWELQNQSEKNPKPISKSDVDKLLSVADDRWTAIIKLSLVAGYYPIDVCQLTWSMIDGHTLSGKRTKTAVGRVAYLPSGVINALGKLPYSGDKVFGLSRDGFKFAYAKLRKTAGVSADFTTIRDATSTIATTVNPLAAEFIMGHSVGIADHYNQRTVDFVRPACQAIADHYEI